MTTDKIFKKSKKDFVDLVRESLCNTIPDVQTEESLNSKHDEDEESMNWGISIKNSKKSENNIFKEFGFVIEALRKKIKGGLYIRTTSTT